VPDLLDDLQSALAGRYTIEREIGHGGMAVVYLALDLRHDRVVALKVLLPRIAEVLGAERFLREIRVAARLHHPHLLPLYDSGEAEGLLYYVMPYVEGGSLRDRLGRDRQMPLLVALQLAREVADALECAHRQSVVHRDIKPENILLDEGHAIVADFGVARAITAAADSDLTQAGMLVGTPAYMSPEQANALPLDGRSDIYALGCVLYEMLAGRPPFAGTSPLALIAQRLTSAAPTLRAAGATVPAAVEALVSRTLAQSPDDRYQTAADLVAELASTERALVQTTPIPAVTQAVVRRATLAVLPFVNISSDPENEFFSDGMTEELINALSRVEGLLVTSRTTVFAYKGREVDVREIGQRLNVAVVLEGSVRRAGNRLRVTAQLVNVSDGYQMWSQTYDRQLADVFEVQDELARSIVNTLRPKLVSSASSPLVLRPTTDVEAYTAYLEGRFFWNKRTPEGYKRGIEFFQLALSRDPHYAMPYTGIADCWAMLAFDYFGVVPPREGMPKAKAAALKALELDGNLVEAQVPLAMVTMLYDWDWLPAEEALQRVLEHRPDYTPARLWYSYLLTVLNRHDESLAVIRRGAELEPLSLMVQLGIARSLHYGRRHEEAVAQCRRSLDMDPGFLTAYETIARALTSLGRFEEAEAFAREGVTRSGRWSLLLGALGRVCGYAGNLAEALAILAELDEQSKQRYVPRFHFGLVYFGLHDAAGALREVERSIGERSGVLPWIALDPQMGWLRSNARFQELLAPLKLPR
jgi:serine/threonine-protein kinase